MRKVIAGCVIACILLSTSCSDHADKENEPEEAASAEQIHILNKEQQEQTKDGGGEADQGSSQQEFTVQSKPELPRAQFLTNRVKLEYIEYNRDTVSFEDLDKLVELDEWQATEILEWYNGIKPDTLQQVSQLELVPRVQIKIQLPGTEKVRILYESNSPDIVYLQVHSSEIITYGTDAENIRLLLETLILDGPYEPIAGTEYRILTEEYLVNDDPNNPKISLFYREYKVYKDYMTGSIEGVGIERVENIIEAKKVLQTDKLKLPPNTIVSPKVLKQWQAEGYYPVQEYSEESIRGLTYDDLLERDK